MFKRAIIYLRKNKLKTLMLFSLMLVCNISISFLMLSYDSAKQYFENGLKTENAQYTIYNEANQLTQEDKKLICSSKFVENCFNSYHESVKTEKELKPIEAKFEENNGMYQIETLRLLAEESFEVDLKNSVQKETYTKFDSYFTKEQIDSAQNVVIMSSELLESNNLNKGDIIKFNFSADSEVEPIEFEIVQTFTPTSGEDNENTDDASIEGNLSYIHSNVYVPTTTFKKIFEEQNEENASEFITTNYIIDSVFSEKAFIKDAQSILSSNGIDDQILYYSTFEDNKLYGIKDSIPIIFIFIVVISICISIVLIIIFSMIISNRKYEIGVLLSLGERKKNIILQFIIENCILMTSSITLSITFSILMFEPIKTYAGIFLYQINEVDLIINLKTIIIIFALNIILVVFAILVSTIKILKSNAKNILMGV